MKQRNIRKMMIPVLILSLLIGTGMNSSSNTVAQSKVVTYDAVSSATQVEKQKAQVITTSQASYLVAYGSGSFSLGADTSGDGQLSYQSSDTSVAKVSSKGTVSMIGCGKAIITITASATSKYYEASKSVLVRVKPKTAKLTTLTSIVTKTMTLTWSKDEKASGYEITIGKNAAFTLGKSVITITSAGTASYKVLSLTKGTTYYAKIRSYVWIGNVKLFGEYSSSKNVKVK